MLIQQLILQATPPGDEMEGLVTCSTHAALELLARLLDQCDHFDVHEGVWLAKIAHLINEPLEFNCDYVAACHLVSRIKTCSCMQSRFRSRGGAEALARGGARWGWGSG